MKTLRNLALIACAAPLFYSCSGGKKDILLRLKLRPNQKIDIKYRTDVVADEGNQQPTRTENVRMSLRVETMSPDSTYNFLSKFDYVRVLDEMVLGPTEYTSDTDPSQLQGKALALDEKLTPVIDSLYIFSIDKMGKVVKPFKFDRVNTAVAAESALVDLSVYQISFPAEMVGVGSTWSSETATTGTNYKRKSNYKVESVYDNTIQLTVDGTIDGGGATQKFTGRYYLNKETNALDSCRLEVKGKPGLSDKQKLLLTVKAK